MESLQKSFKRRVLIFTVCVLSVVFSIFIAISYFLFAKTLENQIGLSAQDVAISVALLIEEDLDSYKDFLQHRDVTSEYYSEMQKRFDLIKKVGNLRFIYTINRINDTDIEFILDSEEIGSADWSAPGDIEEMSPASYKAYQTKMPAVLEPTKSAWGMLIGASAPILDEKREVIGVVGISMDTGVIFSALKSLFMFIIVLCILFIAGICIILDKASSLFVDSLLKDKMTGAYNKRYFNSLLQKSIEECRNTNRGLSVLMLDLDHFKKVNDTYGHPFGDVVLAKIAGIVNSCLRHEDILVRYGGEEFVVLLFNVGEEISQAIAERIRLKIESAVIYNEERDLNVSLTISIGIRYLFGQKISAEALLEQADKALYQAKRTRNTTILYKSDDFLNCHENNDIINKN